MADFIELNGAAINLDHYRKAKKSTYDLPETTWFRTYHTIDLFQARDGFFVSTDRIIYETEEQRDADFEKILNNRRNNGWM